MSKAVNPIEFIKVNEEESVRRGLGLSLSNSNSGGAAKCRLTGDPLYTILNCSSSIYVAALL